MRNLLSPGTEYLVPSSPVPRIWRGEWIGGVVQRPEGPRFIQPDDGNPDAVDQRWVLGVRGPAH
jgi:hypothetical protein